MDYAPMTITWAEAAPTTEPDNTTSNETTSDDDWHIYYGEALQRYMSPILVFFGTFGNVLSFLVLMRKRMRSNAIYNFLLILAVADTTILWVSCFKTWIRRLSGIELLHHSVTMCRLINILFVSSCYLASWIIVLMTVERFLAVWYPLRHRNIWSIKHTRIVAAITVVLAYAANLHVIWTYDHIPWKDRIWCTYIQELEFMKVGFKYLHLALYCFIPFVVVITLNILIIYRLHQNPSFFREDSARSISGSAAQPRERVSVLLLTVSFTWFLLMLPYSIKGFIPVLQNSKILRVLCFMLMYTNHSINFLLYCLTGRKFREELKKMLKMSACCGRKDIRRGGSAKSTVRTELQEGVQMKVLEERKQFLQNNHVRL